MTSANDYLFKAIKGGAYRRDRPPSLITYVPLSKCLQDLDLLTNSITYSLTHGPQERWSDPSFYWNLLSCCIYDDPTSYVSLIWTPPTKLSDMRVTIVKEPSDLILFPILSERVCANLINIIYS